MADQYKTKSTSATSAIVEDICLSENTQFKKVVRAEIVSNPHDSSASVSVTLLVQKASSKNKFEDLPEQSLIKLQAKDIVKLSLKSAETKKLYNELGNLYQIYEKEGVPRGENELVVASADDVIVTDKNKALIIKKLISQNLSEELWQQLIDSDPDLATKLSLSRLQQSRSKTLVSFESMLKQDLTEPEWQCFFEQNTWIFGYGLNFQILKTVSSQPHYGGQTVDGKGINKGDFLQSTQGDAKFTVLVEIKKPSTDLIEKKPYRNDAYPPSSEMNGGVSQLRSNSRRWEHEESREDKNRDALENSHIYTVCPKMILIIGNTNQLNDRMKRESFEMFRRGQRDLEILTFDEIYERAKFIVHHNEEVSEAEISENDCPF